MTLDTSQTGTTEVCCSSEVGQMWEGRERVDLHKQICFVSEQLQRERNKKKGSQFRFLHTLEIT